MWDSNAREYSTGRHRKAGELSCTKRKKVNILRVKRNMLCLEQKMKGIFIVIVCMCVTTYRTKNDKQLPSVTLESRTGDLGWEKHIFLLFCLSLIFFNICVH